jgi:hypothetical protein
LQGGQGGVWMPGGKSDDCSRDRIGWHCGEAKLVAACSCQQELVSCQESAPANRALVEWTERLLIQMCRLLNN